MAQSLTLYSSTDSVSALTTVGTAIAKSGIMRGCDTPEKGMMFAMTAAARNVDILSLAQRYEFIHGQLSMPAKVMLSEFRARGGDHELIERSGDAAEITLTMKGRSTTFRFTWEEAKAEPFIYNGKESEVLRFLAANNQKLLAEKMKPKYQTPRARMQMLWARVVSDGVGAICPEVVIGVYTPEEIDDFDDIEESSASLPVAAISGSGNPAQPSADAGDDAEDAEFTIPVIDIAKTDQVTQMLDLFEALGVDAAARDRAYASVGATELATVTKAGADELIEKMQSRLKESAPSPPAVSESARVADDGSPATEEQIEAIKSLIESVAQREGMAGVPARIREHLNKHDIAKITHLSALSAQALIDSLNGTAGLEDFFDVPPKSVTTG